MRQVRWDGRYLRLVTDGGWEFVERVDGMTAVVMLAEHDGRIILVEQHRVPLGRNCLELPAGLVGDEGASTVEETALKELEEETGFIADGVQRLGEYHSSPGMVAEGFTLVRMTGVRPGGRKSDEPIAVHRVAPDDMAAFVAERRAAGTAVDVKLMLLLAADLLGPRARPA